MKLAFRSPEVCIACLVLAAVPATRADPNWWSDPATIIFNNSPQDSGNWSPVNVGQLKHVATQANSYLDSRLSSGGGSGAAVDSICQFTDVANFQPANVGQLKNVAKCFYDRLIQIHFNWQTGGLGVPSQTYPWTGTTGNTAPANLGQLKYLFSFEISDAFLAANADADGLSDWWEYSFFGALGTASSATDQDSDGLSDGQEEDLGTNPLSGDTDADYLTDSEEFQAGTNSTMADTDGDGLIDYVEIYGTTNALVWDTDGDLVGDLDEQLEGTSPTNPSSVPATLESPILQARHAGVTYGNWQSFAPPPSPINGETFAVFASPDPAYFDFIYRANYFYPWGIPGSSLSSILEWPMENAPFASHYPLSSSETWHYPYTGPWFSYGYTYRLGEVNLSSNRPSDSEDFVYTHQSRVWLRRSRAAETPFTASYILRTRRMLRGTASPDAYSTVQLTVPARRIISAPYDIKPLPPAGAAIGDGSNHATPPGSQDTWVIQEFIPIEFELTHTELDPATGQPVNPGPHAILRDEVVQIRIKIPPINYADWTVDLDVDPQAMRTSDLGNRSNVRMFDFGQIETNGSVTPDRTQVVLQASALGERTIKAVFNKQGSVTIRLRSPDGRANFSSPQYTIIERIRKYAVPYPGFANHDPNQYDQEFIDAATHWGGFYNHPMDSVDRLKAMAVAESNVGALVSNPTLRPHDILTVGTPGDEVLLRIQGQHPTDNHWDLDLAHPKKPAEDDRYRKLDYPQANIASTREAIKWATLWFYAKAFGRPVNIEANPNWTYEKRNQPPYNVIDGIEEPENRFTNWSTWEYATGQYNGGGVSNYMERVNSALQKGIHWNASGSNKLWPIRSDKSGRP